MWYKREEAQLRFSLFFGSATLAGAFESLMASAIQNMNGLRGYNEWRWIFIIEGVATCVLAFASYFLILDFPEDSNWLSREEAIFMQRRLLMNDYDTGPDDSTSKLASLIAYFKDPKTLLEGLMYFGKSSHSHCARLNTNAFYHRRNHSGLRCVTSST